ncbi:MAG: hypothetical protein RL441_1258 [Actinomycetota bacterium]|jgi:hypothetical protein
MTVVDVEESTPDSEGATAGTRWGRSLLVAVSLFVAILIGYTVLAALNPIKWSIDKAELLTIAQSEFQMEYDAINTGRPTSPFAESTQAEAWARHSKLLISAYEETTDAILAGEQSPIEVRIENSGWVFNWFTPTLKLDVLAFSDGEQVNPWRIRELVEFTRIDGQWVVSAVNARSSFNGEGPGLTADSCLQWGPRGADWSACPGFVESDRE